MAIEKLKSFITPPFKTKNSLSIRLLSYILICSSFLAVIITLLQLFVDYQKDVNKIQNSIDQVKSSFVQPLTVSLWNFDKEQIEIQTKGIINLPYIEYVKVNEIIANTEIAMFDQGMAKEKYDISEKFDLTHQGQVVDGLNQIFH